jgi:hypothetical protein
MVIIAKDFFVSAISVCEGKINVSANGILI